MQMKKIVFITGLLLCTQLVFAQADTILSRYEQYIFSTLKVRDDLSNMMSSLNGDGQWRDIDYKDLERGNWQPLNHIKRARDMAFAYAFPASKFYHNAELLKKINLAVDNWVRNRYVCPNWWHNEIGVPQVARDIAVLLRHTLSDPQMANVFSILAQYKIRDDATGANRVWDADLGLHYGLLTKNTELVQTCRDLINQEIKITTGDGVQPDYSFHQHGSRLQMYQYGGAFLLENVRLAWELRGTLLAFPSDKINLLTDFVLNGWQWMTRGINTVPGTMDRSASRKDAMHNSDIRSLIPYLIDLIPERKAELTAIANHQNGEGALIGFRYFPYSDFAAYQQKDFSFFLKTISTRTLATESINSENLKGHLLNSGDAYLIRDGREYFNLMPAWNWEYLPGITSFKGADKIKRKSFAGSVSDGEAGFTSMDYVLESKDGNRSISAKKSWFCFDGKVICLVADLKGKGVDSAYTVMDQCRWIDKVIVNEKNKTLDEGDHSFESLKWVYHHNFVYAPLTHSEGEVQLHSVSARWSDINTSESNETVRDRVFMPFLLHNNLSKERSFAYLVTNAKTSVAAKRITKHSDCKIIRNDSLCQAVVFKDGTMMIAFFEPGSVKIKKDHLSVDKACLVLIRDNKIYVSDPQQDNSSVVVQLNNKKFDVKLPAKGFSTEGTLIR
jgi:chondroitin AC lyase